MIKSYKLALIAIALLLTCLMAGCMGGGIPQAQYDSLKAQLEAQLEAAQAQVDQLQGEIGDVQQQQESAGNQLNAQLKAAQAEIARLNSQIGGLEQQHELVGKTPAETAENIVRHYHETHTYSIIDLFVCGDMAADVWNMLKAQGINALIQVGNVETGAADIVDSNHAWVLAEVSPGNYLALETTAGFVVPQGENALYYQGWSFATPKDYKRYSELLREYNVRVNVINQLQDTAKQAHSEYEKAVDTYNELVDEFNSKYASRPVSTESKVHEAKIEAQLAMVDEKEDRYNQLQGLIDVLEAKMHNITAEIDGLVK